MEQVIVLFALLGAVLNAHKRIEGFYVWLATDMLAALFLFTQELYYMSTMYLLFSASCVYGIWHWKKDVS